MPNHACSASLIVWALFTHWGVARQKLGLGRVSQKLVALSMHTKSHYVSLMRVGDTVRGLCLSLLFWDPIFLPPTSKKVVVGITSFLGLVGWADEAQTNVDEKFFMQQIVTPNGSRVVMLCITSLPFGKDVIRSYFAFSQNRSTCSAML